MVKNWILFIVLSAGVIAGYIYLESSRLKSTPKKPAEPAEKKEEAVKPKPEEKKEPPKVEVKKPEEKPKTKDVRPFAPNPEVQAFLLAPESESPEILVWLTPQGAGVQKLVLSRFKQADYLGRPGVDSGGKLEKLDLIPDDPCVSSFRMYHFPTGKGDPVFGLGEHIWEVVQKPQKDGDVWTAKFKATVPDSKIEIVKTFLLNPKEFHIGLTLEVTNRGETASKFRYQIVGGHGLPVEGEWYTSSFRNSAIGIIDPTASDRLIRDWDESIRVSLRQGGDRVPAEGNPGSNYLLYAGVVNQYFASLIVVDKEQAKDGDRVNPEKMQRILAWARPTLESEEVRGIRGDFSDDSKTLEIREYDASISRTYYLLPRVVDHLKELGIQKNQPLVLSYYEMPHPDNPEVPVRVATWARKGKALRSAMDDLTVRVHSNELDLEPGKTVNHRYFLYHGPVKTRLLGQLGVPAELVDRYTDEYGLYSLTDYPSKNAVSRFFYSIGWTSLLIASTKLMHWLLYLLHFVALGNYGFAILLLTFMVRGIMFPISRKQAILSIKMQELAPEMKKIREKYKDDPLTAHRETSALMKKHNAHPMAGCLPVLLQMPIFLGLYYALQESIHFRLGEFLWMKNLAAPDMLLWWTDSIPWLSDPDSQGAIYYLGPFLNVLPIFAVLLMVVQQKIMAPPPTTEEQEVQQKTMQFMMMFMGVMFYKVAAGLCIYFIVSSAWGLIERRLMPKKTIETVVVAPKLAVAGPAGKYRGKNAKAEPEPEPTFWQRMKKRWEDLLEEAKKK